MTADCILTEYALSHGYGRVWHNGKVVAHHRLAYCEHNKITLESIGELVVRHKCDNRACINPAHLELGTQQDNIDDMMERGRGNWKPRTRPAKLSEQQVAEIRETGQQVGRRILATKYGVSAVTICNVLLHLGKYK